MDLEYLKQNWRRKPIYLKAEIAAWDSSAEEYVYEKKNNFSEDPFLRFVSERVQLTKEDKVLDVGCGAGAYSVAFAEYVKQADGVDLSPRMVQLGNEYAIKNGIKNVSLRVMNWHTEDVSDMKGQYDIVFAHTTPAVIDYETLKKMCDTSKRHCFLCKPARRKDMVFDELKRLAGIEATEGMDDSVSYAFDSLWGWGFNPEISYAEIVWKPRKTLEEANAWFLGRLKGRYSIDAKTEERLKAYLQSVSKNGFVEERIDTTLVNMYWRKNV